MADPFVGEIRIFAGTFAPRNWHFCDGSLLQVANYTELFSILGTIYGGDGRTTFGLPNLSGRAPMHPGTGPGLTRRTLGERSGSETVTLSASNMPTHTHDAVAVTGSPNFGKPDDDAANAALSLATGGNKIYNDGTNLVDMYSNIFSETGSSSPNAINKMQPFLALNFIICLVGLYPSRG